jgi:hypothetical protein
VWSTRRSGYGAGVRRSRRSRVPARDIVTLLVDALATYRITRLLVTDGICDRPREAVLARLREREHTKLVELVECPWCTGFWVAGAVVVARRAAPRPWGLVAEILSYSAAAGIFASAVRSMDDQHDMAEEIQEEREEDRAQLTLEGLREPVR